MPGASWGTRLCCLALLLGHRGQGLCRLLETRREAPGVGARGTGRLVTGRPALQEGSPFWLCCCRSCCRTLGFLPLSPQAGRAHPSASPRGRRSCRAPRLGCGCPCSPCSRALTEWPDPPAPPCLHPALGGSPAPGPAPRLAQPPPRSLAPL